MIATKQEHIGGNTPTNGGRLAIESGMPYIATVKIAGVADLLMHRWNCEAIEAKAGAGKNTKAKKMDDVESYVYRMDSGNLGLPGEYLRMAIIGAAKFKQDPRSPRKSAMDLYKAGVVALTNLSDLGVKNWDYLDKRRAVIQRAGINRVRPAMKSGWRLSVDFQVNLPEYISPEDLNDTIAMAGRLIGIGDFRPTFGRFQIAAFDVQ